MPRSEDARRLPALVVWLHSAGGWLWLALSAPLATLAYLPCVALAPQRRLALALERAYAAALLRALGVTVVVDGREHVVPGRSYVVAANHQSALDIPVLHHALSRGRDLRWLGLRNLVRIPFLGWAFAMSRHVKLDRARREDTLAAISRAIERGRVFHLTRQAGAPVLPVAIAGTRRLRPKTGWRLVPGIVRVRIGPEVRVDTENDVESLVERTRARIESSLDELEST